MEVKLNRIDYTQVGITSKNTLKLLPLAGKTQRVIVGDQDGTILCFQLKRTDLTTIFKAGTHPTGVSSVQLGGPIGGVKDRIFISSGQQVQGYTKKGKQFLNFNTNVTENIVAMHIEGSHLFICTTQVMNHYLDCKDVSYYVCPDKILDILALPTFVSDEMTIVLACQDRVLRILQESKPLYEVDVPGSATVLQLFAESTNDILYGTADGHFGLIRLGSSDAEKIWCVSNSGNKGGVTCLDQYDITQDGISEVLIGRDDGGVEVYAFDDANEPIIIFSYTLSESITSIQGGIVGSAGCPEVICSTFAGWIVGFTTEQPMKSLGSDAVVDVVSQNKIAMLRQDLDELQDKIAVEKDLYQQAGLRSGNMSTIPAFNINDKFLLNADDSCYVLGIETQVPIEGILIQSDVTVDLVDVEKSSAVVSHSPCKAEEGNMLLATYRCQANTTKLEMKVRTIEGQYGTLQVYVTPKVHPKTCILKKYRIKPLSLHQRNHALDSERLMNTLTLQGRFSIVDAHTWVSICLPELPERPPVQEVVTLNFVSVFLGTQLQCVLSKGKATFSSDNISTIAILKDVITKEATGKKIKLDITYNIKPECIQSTLELIHPHLDHQLVLTKKIQLIDGLRELVAHEPDTSFLSPDYMDILENAQQLQAEYNRQPCHLERLYGMITDLYIDKYKFEGENVKGKVSKLIEILDTYELDKLIDFFNNTK